MLTAEALRRDFYYNPELGWFFRRFAMGGNPPWSRAGYVVTKGYRAIKIGARQYREHRLAWLYAHGEWPSDQVDHINRVCADNRIDNLRVVDQSTNKRNCGMYKNNKSGHRGACFYAPSGKWLAQITHHGVRKHLGYYDTPEEAGEAYTRARERT